MAQKTEKSMAFRELMTSLMRRRWLISIVVLITFLSIMMGILISIHNQADVQNEWKELLLVLLGALIGSYGKVIDYWFNDKERDNMLAQKMDEEDGIVMSNVLKDDDSDVIQ